MVCGAINGVVVTRLRINPIIGTLATAGIYRGIAFLLTNGQSHAVASTSFRFLGRTRPLGIPSALIVMLIVMAIGYVVLRYTVSAPDLRHWWQSNRQPACWDQRRSPAPGIVHGGILLRGPEWVGPHVEVRNDDPECVGGHRVGHHCFGDPWRDCPIRRGVARSKAHSLAS